MYQTCYLCSVQIEGKCFVNEVIHTIVMIEINSNSPSKRTTFADSISNRLFGVKIRKTI